MRVHEAAYGDLPPTGTGHRPLYIDLIIPNLPPPAATLPDDTLQPTLQFPAEDDHGASHRYNRALHAILRRPDAPTLTTAMPRAAQACGMDRDTSHTGAPPDLTLQQLVHDIWTTKEELATLLRPSTPEARDRDAHLRALLTTRLVGVMGGCAGESCREVGEAQLVHGVPDSCVGGCGWAGAVVVGGGGI